VQEDAILAEKEIVGVKSLPSEKSFSRKALFLIGKHGLDKNVFSANVIREKDVVEYIQKIEGFHISRQVNSVAQKVLIWGGGGHAKMCIDILRQSNSFSIAGIIDSMKHGVAESILGVPVIGKDENDFARLYKQGYRLAILGIGLVEKHRTREKLYFTLREMGFDLPNIIHPKACVEPSVRIDGDGNQIMANAVIGSDVRIGSNCVINCGSIISHDSIIDSSVHVAPGAILAGSVKVGRNTLIGMGCTVFLRVEIGADVVVHNGVNVFRNIADNEVVSKDK
jgi:sugar O-acyltransferase (sialic acid O-acetyltransferase NeuD family)